MDHQSGEVTAEELLIQAAKLVGKSFKHLRPVCNEIKGM